MIKATTLCLLLGASMASVNQDWDHILSGEVEANFEDLVYMYAQFNTEFKEKTFTALPDTDMFETFKQSVQEIVDHNKAGKSFQMGLNKYSDVDYENWSRDYLNAALDPACKSMNFEAMTEERMARVLKEANMPENLDYRDKNGVSPVKDQGACGSCWTFATVGTLESAQLLKYGHFTPNSEQQIVDCAAGFGDDAGCGGGLPPAAMEYLRYAGGIASEEAYPYTAKNGDCYFKEEMAIVTVPQGSVNITEGDEVEMLHALYNHGPVAIGFEVIPAFRSYKSGVFSSKDCLSTAAAPNHNVLLVGYGTEDGMDYWLLKNSWGASWGDHGFFKLQRGVDMCGIGMCNGYPKEVDIPGEAPVKGWGDKPVAEL
jgi:cathepsin H